MLTGSVIEGSNIVTVTYEGSLGAADVVALRDRLTAVIQERGSARLLIEYGDVDLGRVEPRAMWEDLRSAGVLKDVTRAAIVADQGWIDTLTSLARTVLPVEWRWRWRASTVISATTPSRGCTPEPTPAPGGDSRPA